MERKNGENGGRPEQINKKNEGRLNKKQTDNGRSLISFDKRRSDKGKVTKNMNESHRKSQCKPGRNMFFYLFYILFLAFYCSYHSLSIN